MALLNRSAVSERIGDEVNGADLWRVLFLGEFKFKDDQVCELMGSDVRRTVHNGALAAARAEEVSPYVEFFDEDEIESCDPVSLNPEVLNDEDLKHLASSLRTISQTDIESRIRFGYRPL